MHEHPVEEEAFPRGGGGAYIAPVELKRIREVRVCGGVGGVDGVAGWVESGTRESVLAGSPSSSRQPVRLDVIYVSPFTSLVHVRAFVGGRGGGAGGDVVGHAASPQVVDGQKAEAGRNGRRETEVVVGGYV